MVRLSVQPFGTGDRAGICLHGKGQQFEQLIPVVRDRARRTGIVVIDLIGQSLGRQDFHGHTLAGSQAGEEEVYSGISVGSHGNGVQRLSVMGICVGKKRFQLVKKRRFKYRCIHGFMFLSVILGYR